MHFPYDHYHTITEPLMAYYPAGEEDFTRWVLQTTRQAMQRLTVLFQRPAPEFDILVVSADDWPLAPHSEPEEVQTLHPYWTDVTSPSTLVVPVEIDQLFGDVTPTKFAFMLYHELALAFLEDDERPWPEDSPLWADEWQFKCTALWLSHELDGVQGIVNVDLHEQYADIMEPEIDGKTPVTIRGFDWYEDTTPEDYLCYDLLLEQFAADLLSYADIDVLPRFLSTYRQDISRLLSDDVTKMLAQALGPQGEDWLEELVYF